MKMTKKNITFCALVLILVFESIIKYQGVNWVTNEYGTLASMTGKSLGVFVASSLLVVSILLLFSLRKENKTILICGYFLIVFGVIWSIADYKGLTLFYLNASPILLICFGMIYMIGQSNIIQLCMEKSCGYLAIFYTVLSFINALYFMKNYTKMRMADGKVIEYFALALFLTAIWNLVAVQSKTSVFLIYILCVIHIITSSIIVSRGWFLQACTLTVFCHLSNSDRSSKYKVVRIFVTILCSLIVGIILMYYFNDSFEFLFARLYEDTRTGQYQIFFKQVSIIDLLVGKGLNAHYKFGANGDYQAIDNQFIYWMFKYGAFPMICYLTPFVLAIVRAFVNHDSRELLLKRIYVPLMWVASMAGISIYYGLKMDIAHFYILLTIVRLAIKPYISIRGGK